MEVLAEAGGVVFALLIAYRTPRGGPLDYTYVLFVPLLWVAARHGFARTTATVLALNVGAALLAGPAVGPTGGLALQFGLLTLTLSGLLMGAVVDDRRRQQDALAASYDATLAGWARALELRDNETAGHTARVAALTARLARAHGISGEELVHLRRGALLHDIGKLGVPDAILHKPGPLTDEEWVVMRRHPDHARELLDPIAYLRPALTIPQYHHERWDGAGYPRGLAGEAIPLAARLFTAVDAWDALTTARPYRLAWSPARARAHLEVEAGHQFDPAAVAAFLALLDAETARTAGDTYGSATT